MLPLDPHKCRFVDPGSFAGTVGRKCAWHKSILPGHPCKRSSEARRPCHPTCSHPAPKPAGVAQTNSLDVWTPVGFPRRLLVLPCRYTCGIGTTSEFPSNYQCARTRVWTLSQDLAQDESTPTSPHSATRPPLTTYPPVGDMLQGLVTLLVMVQRTNLETCEVYPLQPLSPKGLPKRFELSYRQTWTGRACQSPPRGR